MFFIHATIDFLLLHSLTAHFLCLVCCLSQRSIHEMRACGSKQHLMNILVRFIRSDYDEVMSGCGSIKSSRVLLQRGLRINSSSRNLWLQYFCLELHYIQKLRGRREILQLNLDAAKNKTTSKGCDVDEATKDDNAAEIEINEGMKLPLIIYKNTIKSIPEDIAFRIQFIEQSKLFPETQSLVDHIMNTVETDFENMEDAWIARACFLLDNQETEDGDKNKHGFFLSNEPNASEDNDGSTVRKRKRAELCDSESNTLDEKLIEILSEATNAIGSSKMFIESMKLLRNYMAKLSSTLEEEEEDEILDATGERISRIIQFIVKLINKAEAIVAVTPELAIEMAISLLELG